MSSPLTRWQRFVARLLPWYEPAEQDRRIQRSERLAAKVSLNHRIRADYRAQDDRMAGRR